MTELSLPPGAVRRKNKVRVSKGEIEEKKVS